MCYNKYMDTKQTTMKITTKITYDFVSDNPLKDVVDVLELSNVKPLSITFNPTMYDNITVEFDSTEDTVAFTKVYLDSDNSTDIEEYVKTSE